MHIICSRARDSRNLQHTSLLFYSLSTKKTSYVSASLDFFFFFFFFFTLLSAVLLFFLLLGVLCPLSCEEEDDEEEEEEEEEEGEQGEVPPPYLAGVRSSSLKDLRAGTPLTSASSSGIRRTWKSSLYSSSIWSRYLQIDRNQATRIRKSVAAGGREIRVTYSNGHSRITNEERKRKKKCNSQREHRREKVIAEAIEVDLSSSSSWAVWR